MTAAAPTLRDDARTIALIGLAHGTSHFFHMLLPPLFPLFIRDFGFSYSELGLLVSTFTESQVAALAAASLVTMIPTVQFSGLTNPVSSLEGFAAIVGRIFPATYFISLCRGVFSKSLGFAEHGFDLLVLGVGGPVLIALSIALLRKQGR